MISHGQPLSLHAPLLPDADYLALLESLGTRLHSLYLSLDDPAIPDARPAAARRDDAGAQALAAFLARPGPPVYALLNSRFHQPERYADGGTADIAQALERLPRERVRGVVHADAILLTRLARDHPALVRTLEAVPSVNCCLDQWTKARQHLDLLADLGFRPPGHLIPDRSLNRNFEALARFGEATARELPGAALLLLANEGCLWQCPYKPAHDALLAWQRCAGGPSGFATLRDAACLRRYAREPWRILASPWIRPRDLPRCQGLAQGVKLSGRSRGPRAMARVVTAYATGQCEGNFLELLDTLEALAQVTHLDEAALPEDFLERSMTEGEDWFKAVAARALRRRRPAAPRREAGMD